MSTANTTIQEHEECAAQVKSRLINDATSETKTIVSDSTILDLLDISTNEPSETDCLLDIFSNASNGCRTNNTQSAQSSSNLLTFDFLKKLHGPTTASAAASSCIPSSSEASKAKGVNNTSKISDKKSAWMDLFADLDPLSNLTAMEKKIAGANQNCLDA